MTIIDDIVYDSNILVGQTPETNAIYLKAAIEKIDNRLGREYAKNHPELIGAFIISCAIDFHSSMLTLASKNYQDDLSS